MRLVTWKKESTEIPQSPTCVRETEIPVSSPELINAQISHLNSKLTVKPGEKISYKNAVGEFYDSDDNQKVKKISRIIKRKDIFNINFKIVVCDNPDAILFEKDLGNPYLKGTGCDLNPGNLPAMKVKYIMDVRDKNNKSIIIIEKEVQLYVLNTNQLEIKLTKYLSD